MLFRSIRVCRIEEMVHNVGFGRVGIVGIDGNVGNGGSVGFGN